MVEWKKLTLEIHFFKLQISSYRVLESQSAIGFINETLINSIWMFIIQLLFVPGVIGTGMRLFLERVLILNLNLDDLWANISLFCLFSNIQSSRKIDGSLLWVEFVFACNSQFSFSKIKSSIFCFKYKCGVPIFWSPATKNVSGKICFLLFWIFLWG